MNEDLCPCPCHRKRYAQELLTWPARLPCPCKTLTTKYGPLQVDEKITIRLPRSHWSQIVSDLENMCGTGEEDIEILQQVEILEGDR